MNISQRPLRNTSGLLRLEPDIRERLRIAAKPTTVMPVVKVARIVPAVTDPADTWINDTQLELTDPRRSTADMALELINNYLRAYGRYPQYLLIGKATRRRNDFPANQYFIPGTQQIINVSYVPDVTDVKVR